MATYEVVLKDRTIERIEAADAYQQEGQMTTFFALGDGRRVVDCWSSRLASFRTSEILIIRRSDALAERATPITELAERRSA
ncbi:MAG: hypothetical protein R2726_09985 [Acidimicrobiales bacterium]